MKKRVLVLALFFLILSLHLVLAEDETTEEKAYACIEGKTSKCSSLSTSEKIFSMLSVGKCKTELISDASSRACWPKSGCDIKTTALAILALNKTGYNTSKSELWLTSHNLSFDGINWFLQVANLGTASEASCTAKYSGHSYDFKINEDKTISEDAGDCLTKAGYWFEIDSDCYDKKFEISCADSFLTSLLYRKPGSAIVYISDKTNSASGDGTTTEQVKSFCFSEGDVCDYEGTLWASVVMNYRGKDVSLFIPYLISMADENAEYIPESFLYSLTDNFRTELLAKQTENWWSASGDKFYDTAVALLPFQNEDSLPEKINSQKWLGEVQGKDGCWQGNMKNTAFLLYSLWPGQIAEVIVSNESNKTSEYKPTTSKCENCMSQASCSLLSGSILENYTGCFGTNICCSKMKQIDSCSVQNGELCSSDEDCLGGSFVSSSDSSSKNCCIDGTCGAQTSSGCELNNGICKSSCNEGEEYSSYDCPSSGVCCIPSKEKAVNTLVIIIMIVLIALVIIGIIFRRKIREFFFRFGGKKKPSVSGPRFPPTSSSRVYPGAVPRRIIPNQTQRAPLPPSRSKTEFDDVLKKLKEIGK